ncbi:hypothetical protein BaRGS_00037180 [Batillaria attramentaria]|uniref:Uncharacterized protein n=1 Tax=Batillaria attramentaria TaxID=370345 RepID=A0ABD0J9U2_9CAEN
MNENVHERVLLLSGVKNKSCFRPVIELPEPLRTSALFRASKRDDSRTSGEPRQMKEEHAVGSARGVVSLLIRGSSSGRTYQKLKKVVTNPMQMVEGPFFPIHPVSGRKICLQTISDRKVISYWQWLDVDARTIRCLAKRTRPVSSVYTFCFIR